MPPYFAGEVARLAQLMRGDAASRPAPKPAAASAPNPYRMGQVKAALLMRDLRQALAAAAKAGHRPPPVRLDRADGMSRQDAATLAGWGLNLPGVGDAYASVMHPAHREIFGLRELVRYFRFDRPAHDDGRPKSWAEAGAPPLSTAMQAVLRGDRAPETVAVGEYHPTEAAALADYGVQRYYGDGSGGGDRAAAIKSEISAYLSRAAEPTPAPGPTTLTTPGAAAETQIMDETAAQGRVKELMLGLYGKMSAPDRHIIGEELMEIYEAFPGIKPPVLSREEIAEARQKPQTVHSREFASERSIELVEELKGDRAFGSTARQAKLAELQRTLEASPTGTQHATLPGVRSSGPMIVERRDFRSDRTRELGAQLMKREGSIYERRALREQLMQSLETDQAAADSGQAAA